MTELLFNEHRLEFPRDNSFHNRLKTLTFDGILPTLIKDLFYNIKNKGNIAVHQRIGTDNDAKSVLYSAFKVSKWFYETYSLGMNDISTVRFSPPKKLDARHAINELEKNFKELEEKYNKLQAERTTEGISEDRQKEIAKRSNVAVNKLEMSEEETRILIDEQLRAAGWEVDTVNLNFKTKKTLPQRCLLYTSPSPRDATLSRMPSSA